MHESLELKSNLILGAWVLIYVGIYIYVRIKGRGEERLLKIYKYLMPALIVITLSILLYPLVPIWVTAPLSLPLGLFAAWGARGYVRIIYRANEIRKTGREVNTDEDKAPK